MQRFVFAKRDMIWEVAYDGKRTVRTREGVDAVFGTPSVTTLASPAKARAAANAAIEARVAKGFRELVGERLRSNVPGARYASYPTLAKVLGKPRASKRWRTRLGHATYLLEDGALLYPGRLVVDSLAIGPNALVVAGDLVVRGHLRDGQRADETALIVLGSLRAGTCATRSAILVAGDCTIRGALFGASAHDHVLAVNGELRAGTVVDGDHWFEARSSSVGTLVGTRGCFLGPVSTRILEPHRGLRAGTWRWLDAGVSVVQRERLWRAMERGRAIAPR